MSDTIMMMLCFMFTISAFWIALSMQSIKEEAARSRNLLDQIAASLEGLLVDFQQEHRK